MKTSLSLVRSARDRLARRRKYVLADGGVSYAIGVLGFHFEMPPDHRSGQWLDVEDHFTVLENTHRY